MSQTAAGADPGPKSFVGRFTGILFSPRETYESVVRHHGWVGMLALSTVFTAGCMFLLLSTEVGRQASIDQQVSAIESWGGTVDDAMYGQLEQRAKFNKYITPAAILVMAPVWTFVLAGMLLGLFSALFGGTATYRQVLSVVAHTAPVSIVQQLFTQPINYFRGSLSSPTNLSVFFPMLEEKSFLVALLGTIDLFLVWTVIVGAIGIAVLYGRKTRPAAIALFVTYGVIAVVLALAKSFFTRGA